MIFEQKYKIGVEDIGTDHYLSNRGLLSFLEDIACLHAHKVGFGILDVEQKGVAWILLEWKVKVIHRPIYDTTVTVRTWVPKADRLICTRDFEVVDEKGEILAIASSKWVLMNMNLRKMVKLTEEYLSVFGMEEGKRAFEEENELPGEIGKIVESSEYQTCTSYEVQRRDIDMNHHLHNLNYLYIAYEMLPETVFENTVYDEMVIEYKKEIKYGDKVNCYYVQEGNWDVVTFKVEDRLNAVVKLRRR